MKKSFLRSVNNIEGDVNGNVVVAGGGSTPYDLTLAKLDIAYGYRAADREWVYRLEEDTSWASGFSLHNIANNYSDLASTMSSFGVNPQMGFVHRIDGQRRFVLNTVINGFCNFNKARVVLRTTTDPSGTFNTLTGETWFGGNLSLETTVLINRGYGNETWEVYTMGDYNLSGTANKGGLFWVKRFGISSGGLTNITYNNLAVAVAGNTLVAGTWYKITDYQTVHTIPQSTATNTGAVEPLIIQALTTNNLAPIAYSETYPQDIIYYNIENDTTKVVGCTKGWISRRIDTDYQNDISFDFRAVKFRRYASNFTSVYNAGTTYARFDYVINGAGFIYRSVQPSNVGHALSDMDWWVETGNEVADFVNAKEDVSYGTVNMASYADYPLFDPADYNSGFVVNNLFRYHHAFGNGEIYSDILSAQNNVFIGVKVTGNRIETPKFTDNFFKGNETALPNWNQKKYGFFTNNRVDTNSEFMGNIMRQGWFIESLSVTNIGYFSKNRFCGGSIFNTDLCNNSGIYDSMWYWGDIDDMQITSSSQINRNCMTGSIYSCIYNNTYMYDCTWRSGMSGVTCTATRFSNIVPSPLNTWITKTSYLGVNIGNNSTYLSDNNYAKNVFSRQDGAVRYSYVNNSDVLVIGFLY